MTAARHSASVSGDTHDGVGAGVGGGGAAQTRTRLPPGSPVGLPELDQKPQLAYVPLAYV